MEKITVRRFRNNFGGYMARIKGGEHFEVGGIILGEILENRVVGSDVATRVATRGRSVATDGDKVGVEGENRDVGGEIIKEALDSAGFSVGMYEEEMGEEGEGREEEGVRSRVCDHCKKMTKVLYRHWEEERGEMEICERCARGAWVGNVKMIKEHLDKTRI